MSSGLAVAYYLFKVCFSNNTCFFAIFSRKFLNNASLSTKWTVMSGNIGEI